MRIKKTDKPVIPTVSVTKSPDAVELVWPGGHAGPHARPMRRFDTPRGYWQALPPMASADTRPKRGYTASKDQLLTRLKRVEGQVRGVERMVEEDRYRIEVLTQIAAVQAALDKVALGLLDGHARHCIVEGHAEAPPEELSDELMAAVGRLMRRGSAALLSSVALSAASHLPRRTVR